MGLLRGSAGRVSERKLLLEQARALGMSLAPLRALPLSEVRKRIHARKHDQTRYNQQRGERKGGRS